FVWPLGLMYLHRLLLETKQRPGKLSPVHAPFLPVNRLFVGLSRSAQRRMQFAIRWSLGSSPLAVVARPRALSLDTGAAALGRIDIPLRVPLNMCLRVS